MNTRNTLVLQLVKYNIATETELEASSKDVWSMSCDQYVKPVVAAVPKKPSFKAFTRKYQPEIDLSNLLNDERANYYQGLIGVLRWIAELGRIDIITSVAYLSCSLAAPQEGHLEAAFHIFTYLKKYGRKQLVSGNTYLTHDESKFSKADWSQFYPGAANAIPPNMPNRSWVAFYTDTDHAGCQVTLRSQTGILIYIQKSAIIWYSKRQNTVKSSTFGSEFIAMKTAVEQVEALRYELHMMGVPIDGPASIYCDNQSVFKNTS
jgi:hypothetical protein